MSWFVCLETCYVSLCHAQRKCRRLWVSISRCVLVITTRGRLYTRYVPPVKRHSKSGRPEVARERWLCTYARKARSTHPSARPPDRSPLAVRLQVIQTESPRRQRLPFGTSLHQRRKLAQGLVAVWSRCQQHQGARCGHTVDTDGQILRQRRGRRHAQDGLNARLAAGFAKDHSAVEPVAAPPRNV